MMKFNQAQVKYITDRYVSDSRVRNGMDLINKIQSTKYGQHVLNGAKQRTKARFDYYMIDVVDCRAAKNSELPPIIKYKLMVGHFADKTSLELKEEDIVNVFKHFGFGERQTRMDLIDALNPEVELSEDVMLSENDMDDIILALSVCMYAVFKVDRYYYAADEYYNQPQYADSRLCAFA